MAMEGNSNSALITGFLRHNYDIHKYDGSMEITSRFDLIIADGQTLTRLKVTHPDLKQSAGPLFQPVLLVSTKKGVGLITGRLWQTVDEVITTPISKMELLARVEVLMRARRQSLLLHELKSGIEGENGRLKKESRALTDYFMNLSHELRTPLSVILSSIDFLSLCFDEEIIKPETFRNTLEISKRNCHRLLRLFNNMLDLTKIDAGRMSLSLCNIEPAKALREIVDSVQDYARKKDLTINFISDTRCRNIAVDEEMLGRIMLNLLSNAIKYTPSGGVITVVLQDSHNRGNILITVKDNGIGIPAEMHQAVFDRFVQADNTMSKRSEGCGLGLALARSLVELHGGRLWMESKLGIGSRFGFELPEKTVEAAPMGRGQDIRDRVEYEFSDL